MNRSAIETKRLQSARAALKRIVDVGAEGVTGRELFGDEWSTVSRSNWCYRLVRTMRDRGLVYAASVRGRSAGLWITGAAALVAVLDDDSAIEELLWPQERVMGATEAVSEPPATEGRAPATREQITAAQLPHRIAQAQAALQQLIRRTAKGCDATGMELFDDEWTPSRGGWYTMMQRLEALGLVTVARPHGRRQLFVAQAGLADLAFDKTKLRGMLPPAIFRALRDSDDEEEAPQPVVVPAAPIPEELAEPTDRDLLEGILKICAAVGEGQGALVERILGLEQKIVNLQQLWK